jgi:amino acid transporter
MWLNLVVSFTFLFFFRGWGKLAEVISVATIITYLIVPVSVGVLRRTAPALARPLRIPGIEVLSPAAFVFATLMLYWARWPHTGEIMLLLIVPVPLYLYGQSRTGWRDFPRHLAGAWWMVAYFAVLVALSFAGSREFGGLDYLSYGWDQACVALMALVFYYWGRRSGWHTPALAALEASRAS